MPAQTRAMKKRAEEAQEAPGGNRTAATTAAGATNTATTTTATRAPRKKTTTAPTTTATRAPRKKTTTATTTSATRAPRKKTTTAPTTTAIRAPRKKTAGKNVAKGKKSVDKVQKSTKTKKIDAKAIQKAKQKGKGKAKGKQVDDETENESPEPEPEPVSKAKGKGKSRQVADHTEEKDSEPEPEAGPVKGKGKGKGDAKVKTGTKRVQKSTKPKKGGTKAVQKAKREGKGKGKGKQVADEIELEDPKPQSEPEPEPEPEPISKGKEKGNKEVKGRKVVDKVQKSTKPKKGGIKEVWKAKKKGKGKEVTDVPELGDAKAVSQGAGKGKEAAAGKADKTEGEQVQTVGEKHGTQNAAAAREGRGEILQRFIRADLEEAGALESEGVEMPTLNNDIHPIWAPEKFIFLSATNGTEFAEAYAAISPALRLASLWIEQPQYEDFWATMWHGQYLKPGKSGRLMRIARLGEDQAKNLEKNNPGNGLTSKEFRDLAEFKSKWRFGPQALGTWAKTEQGITTLHDDFEWLARSPQPNTTTSERLRLYFFLALNLGRELVQQVCHFKHRKQYGDNVEPPTRPSIFYQSAESAGLPLDVAWENFMFKGPIHQINTPPDPMAPDGLAVHHFRLQDDNERVYMPVQVDWISERFSMDSWLADDLDQDHMLPGLPSGSDVYAREMVIDEV